MNHRKLIKEENTFDYIFVGRMVKDKGVNELIHAFLILYTFYPSVRLYLVGDFERNLDPIADDVQTNKKKRILLLKFGDFKNDVRPFFAAADVLVFPSYREGFPNVCCRQVL